MAQFANPAGTDPEVATDRDTIKGWNDRRKSNNQTISTMVPFVQLIGLFDVEDYTQMFRMATMKRVPVVYDDQTKPSAAWNEKYALNTNYITEIERQVKERFINLYIFSSTDHGLEQSPINGIVMAESVTQQQDVSGGVGITDLQVDYGKSTILGSRKFVLRLTVNNPKILDERMEYANLATFGSQFLIIYGWSNPEVIPGYDAAMSPPKLKDDPNDSTRKCMYVPIRNLGNGGYWSAGRVNVNKYDFGFNEQGKLEMTVEFLDDAVLGLGSTTMSSVARDFKLYLQGGVLDQIITGSTGQEFTLREALHQRQIELNNLFRKRMEDGEEGAYEEYTSLWAEAERTLEDSLAIDGIKNSAALEKGVNDQYSFTTEANIRKNQDEARAVQKGYPQQNAMFSFKKVFKTVFDPDNQDAIDSSEEDQQKADEEGLPASAAPTKQITDYEKKPVYYYLGAIMDSIALCMTGPQLGIGARKVPSFFYRDLSKDSKLGTVFQSQLKEANRGTSMEERIQEAIIRLKERFLPPAPIEHEAADAYTFLGAGGTEATSNLDPIISRLYGEIRIGFTFIGMVGLTDGGKHLIASRKSRNVTVSGTRPVYAGEQTQLKDRIIDAIFPAPPNVGRMIYAPMRGHVYGLSEATAINIEDYRDLLVEKSILDAGHDELEPLICYVPDWQQEDIISVEGEESVSSGSPDGFNPLNPNEYRAAAPRPKETEPAETLDETLSDRQHETFSERSEEPFGRGGRFWMIKEYELNNVTYRTILSYENWRRSDKATWNLLQKKWNNLYREYLGNYFESVIRKRINQIEPLGIPIEALYNEPLDLDWLTGVIYNQAGDDPYQLKSWDDIRGWSSAESIADAFDLQSSQDKLNQDIEKYNEIIIQNNNIINGIGPLAGNDPRITSYRAAQALNPFVSAETVYHGLLGTSARLVEQINTRKVEIEQLTGGRYDRGPAGLIITEDDMGNIIMEGFKNFDKIIASQDKFAETPVRYDVSAEDARISIESANQRGEKIAGSSLDSNPPYIELSIGVFEPEIQLERKIETPKVKEEWVLWSEYNVPTNNFQNRYNFAYSPEALLDEGFIDQLNKAERWKQENSQLYDTAVLPKVTADEKIVEEKLNEIKVFQNELNKIYDHYQQCRTAIDNANAEVVKKSRRMAMFHEYYNDNQQLQLSIYDDTSDFDGDGVEIDVGRDEPMHLTTRVAQQWRLRFLSIVKRGASDVRNYGPPQGGQKYQLPINSYEFVYAEERREWGVVGQPRRVIDPEIFTRNDASSPEEIIEIAKIMLSDLSFGIDINDIEEEILSKNVNYPDVKLGIRTIVKGYKNWSLFGSPGIPNENGNNRWGFKYGPYTERVLAGGEIELTGGNYVKTYKDFLNLFMLVSNPDLPGPLRIVGKWPGVEDTAVEVTSILNQQATAMAMGKKFGRSTAAVDRYFEASHDDKKKLIEASSAGVPVYTIIDGIGNILVDDDNGWYHPSGWYLDYAGDPVFLYPSRTTTCRINNTGRYDNNVPPGGVLQKGITEGQGKVWARDDGVIGAKPHEGDRQTVGAGWRDGHHSPPGGPGKGGRTKKWTQKIQDGFANYFKNVWAALGALMDGDFDEYAERLVGTYGIGKFGFMRQFRDAMKKVNDGIHRPTWGARIGLGEHCMNLTLDMKQSMIYSRPSAEDKTRYLGYDMPGGGGTHTPLRTVIDYDAIEEGQDGLYRLTRAHVSIRGGRADAGDFAEYDHYIYKEDAFANTLDPDATGEQAAEFEAAAVAEEIALGRVEDEHGNLVGSGHVDRSLVRVVPTIGNRDQLEPAPGATLIGPLKSVNWPPYSNPQYPYGTGWYDGQAKQHGPWVFPEHNKNWRDWNEFLRALGPENSYGFFTAVDNRNNTSCMVQPNGAITDGQELNEGFVKFIIENVYAPLPKNRRCGVRPNHKPIKIMGSRNGNDVGGYHENERLDDVTYADLFGPLRDDDDDEAAESALGPATFGNIDNFEINNVKDIPIRSVVIDNMVNKNNTNMSITQFLGEMFRPGSIGVNSAGNQHLAMRQGEDGVFEVFSLSSLNWKKKVKEYDHLFNDFIGGKDEEKKRFPEDIIMVDFKTSDSLIESINMNSTFDMLTARAFRDAAEDFTGNADALLNFMSYKDIAPELQKYFEENYKGYDKNAITIDEGSGTVKLNKSFFMRENQVTEVVKDHVTGYLQDNPGRLNAIRALLRAAEESQSNVEDGVTEGQNAPTQLLSNYMRKTIITIHGTTNIMPFQIILVKGLMTDLEGLYWITNTRESVTPQGFQTILEGSLLDYPSTNARKQNADNWPVEREEGDVTKLAAAGEKAKSVDDVLDSVI